MITEAHLHLRQNIKREVRARTYQIHAVRCTSRHRNREDHVHINTQKKIDRMKITTRRRKNEIKIENYHKYLILKERERKKVQVRRGSNRSKKSKKGTHKRMRKNSQIAGSHCSRGV